MAELLPFPGPAATPDAVARDRALDTAASFIVEAPAGSGKTGLLIQRFLKLLAHPSVAQPAQVLAITFTRKATAEMRDRVFRQLADADTGVLPANAFDELTRPLAQEVLARDRALGWNLLEAPHRLNVRTIDSVCADIARGLPVLSGSGGGPAPIEDARPLHLEAARRTLMLLGNPDTQPLTAALELLLLHRDGNLRDCETLLADMLGTRDQWGDLVPLAEQTLTEDYLDATVLPRLDRALDLAVCRALTRLTQLLPAGFLERLSSIAEDMAHADGYNGAPSPLALCRGRNQPPRERADDLEHWRALLHLVISPSSQDWRKSFNKNYLKVELSKFHAATLKEIVDSVRGDETLREALCSLSDLPPGEYPRDQWPLAKALFRVLARALVELQFVFAERSQCDFTEAALQAKVALRRPGALDDLRASSVLDLEHLLVDEMQDTSTSQYELIQLLTSHWDGHSQTVFLVGDPKQSIYLFRQARVERFVQTMLHQTLGAGQDALVVEPLQLTANFRSQRALVADFNTTFTQLFPRDPDPHRPELVPYREASATRSASPGAAAQVWHTAILPYTADTALATTMRQTQARADAQEIRRLVLEHQARSRTNGKAPTLAVLVRNRTHLLEVIAAFKTAPAIPYRAVDIEPLAERQEILDLLTLTRALLHPADRTAWLALLRTPWVGLTLPDLLTLTGAEDQEAASATHPMIDLLASRGELLSADGIARLEPFWPVISAALAQRTELPLARLVARTWHAFRAPAFATDEELANATRLFTLLDQLETTQGIVDLPTLESRLRSLYATPAPMAGAVDLSTMHKAKGLEWDVVFLPALNSPGRNSAANLLAWLETDLGNDDEPDDTAAGILAPIQAKGAESHALAAWMRSIESARAAAERTRLFYVACTRAREELHLFAATARNSKGEVCPRAGSLLAAAWPAAAEHFVTEIPLLTLPAPAPLALAATAEPRAILRLPLLTSSPALLSHATRTQALTQSGETITRSSYSRPEGSFAARSFGNSMHAFLELLATRIAAGQTPAELLAELPTWNPRFLAVLRGSGLALPLAERFAAQLARGLGNTLRSPEGLWLLASHPRAATESALTTFEDDATRTTRLDRTFLAGPTPLSTGDTHLWVVDYKTGSHAAGDLDRFFADELKKYRPQLENYAHTLDAIAQGRPLRLALFYPMLPKLLPWLPEQQ